MQQYNTIVLQHHWAYRWVDKLGLDGFSLALALFALAFIPCYLAEQLLAANTIRDTLPPPELKFVFAALPALLITVWISLIRGAQIDFEELEKSGLVENAPYNDLVQRNQSLRILELFFGFLFGFSLYVVGRASATLISVHASLLESLNDLSYWFVAPFNLLAWISFAITGLAIIRITVFLWRQTKLFLNMAKTVKIDLLGTELLAVFAQQPLRTLTGAIAVMSGLFVLGNIEGELRNSSYSIGIPMQLIMFMATVIVSTPVWHLRKRMRKAKRRELKRIHRAIKGDPDALIGSRIESHREAFQLPDLLYYEDRINAIWEWPVHAHVRRMAFYIIIPPVAWLMAALVEIMLDGYLGPAGP